MYKYTEQQAFQKVLLKYPQARVDHRMIAKPIIKHTLWASLLDSSAHDAELRSTPDFWTSNDINNLTLGLRREVISFAARHRPHKEDWWNLKSDGYFIVGRCCDADFQMHIIEIENTAPISNRRKNVYTSMMTWIDEFCDFPIYIHAFDRCGFNERVYDVSPTRAMIAACNGTTVFDMQPGCDWVVDDLYKMMA